MKYLEHNKELKRIASYLRQYSSMMSKKSISSILISYPDQYLDIIKQLEKLDLPENIQYYINNIRRTNVFSNGRHPSSLTPDESNLLINNTNDIEVALETLISNNKKILGQASEDTIFVRLPDINSLEELSKVANDLKKSIELPILDLRNNSTVKIVSVQPGSIWLTITVGSLVAVGVIGRICLAAIKIKKRWAEARMMEENVRTYKLNNDTIAELADAVKTQLSNMKDAEARDIQPNYYHHNDPETQERLKHSISTMLDLVNRGMKVIPSTDDEKVTKSFPDFTLPNLIDTATKNLPEESN